MGLDIGRTWMMDVVLIYKMPALGLQIIFCVGDDLESILQKIPARNFLLCVGGHIFCVNRNLRFMVYIRIYIQQ